MTRTTRELAQAVHHLLSLRDYMVVEGCPFVKVEVMNVHKNVFERLERALADLEAEGNTRVRVKHNKCGLDNERYEAMAGPLENVIASMGLTTPAQVLALCDMAYGQQGKVVVHTSSGCVSVREGGRNGREMFWIKGEGPDWE